MSTLQRYQLVPAGELDKAACRRLLATLVVPRPIAWISTRSAAGVANLAPFSSFAVLADDPPLVGVSIDRGHDGPKDTLANIRATGCFCINRVTAPFVEFMHRSAGSYPPAVDEFRIAAATAAPADRVRAPWVRGVSAALECTLLREVDLSPAAAVQIVGAVIAFRLSPELTPVLSGEAVDRTLPVGHVGTGSYTLTREVWPLPPVPEEDHGPEP